jgi:hypothetical protein
MGFFNKIFGQDKEYPELEATDPVAHSVNSFMHDLEILAREVDDSLEVVPARDTAYVFIGKPPKKFGVAWIRNGKINNFKTLAKEKDIPEMKLQLMSEKLRKAYEKSENASRYSTTIADKKVIVTSSDTLLEDLKQII